jgi:hypothetical protein
LNDIDENEAASVRSFQWFYVFVKTQLRTNPPHLDDNAIGDGCNRRLVQDLASINDAFGADLCLRGSVQESNE